MEILLQLQTVWQSAYVADLGNTYYVGGKEEKMKSNGTLLDWPVKTRDMVMSHVLSASPRKHSINGVWLKGFFWGALSAFWIWFLFACKAPWWEEVKEWKKTLARNVRKWRVPCKWSRPGHPIITTISGRSKTTTIWQTWKTLKRNATRCWRRKNENQTHFYGLEEKRQ